MSVGTVNRNCVVVELGGQTDGVDARSQISGLDQQIMGLLRQQLQKRDGAGGGSRETMTAQSAAGALASYMSQNKMSAVDPDLLYKFAMNPSSGTPEDVSKAAKFMLDHPDTYQKIETHDVAGADGISGIGNFQWAAQGGLDSGSAARTADTGSAEEVKLGSQTEINDAPMTAQSAAGALGSYMSQNGLSTVDPNRLYQLAMNPSSGTPGDVSKAAKFMLANPDTYRQLETHDAAGADGISGVANFQWAAQGGLDSGSVAQTADAGSAAEATLGSGAETEGSDSDGSDAGINNASMTAQSAAGALGSYMSQNGLSTVDPNRLYQLAMNPSSGTPGDVSKAAKFMLANPDTYRQLETHDAAGADGISGVANFQWAAQGGLDSFAAADTKMAAGPILAGATVMAAGPSLTAVAKSEAGMKSEAGVKSGGWQSAIDAMNSAADQAAKAQTAASTISGADPADSASDDNA
ncbi:MULTISPECIES: hypothetical protein [Burkholderia]|uniref:hypothetical protein n=1 Tax=Burkholderia TaxID=32008 RepID=UPI001589DA9C|nr:MULTISPECIES: hypothetical protein [Burkholderia]MCU9952136.1 hypothetical protein [Burkholderia sp. BKH01]